MMRQHGAAVILMALAIAGILAAAALAGSSEARFAVEGSLVCPPYDVPRPVPPEDRTGDWLASYRGPALAWQRGQEQRAVEYFVNTRTSMAAAPRASIEALEPIKRFRDAVSGADRVVTGKVVGQRLGYYTTEFGRAVGLVSQLDGSGVRVVHRIGMHAPSQSCSATTR